MYELSPKLFYFITFLITFLIIVLLIIIINKNTSDLGIKWIKQNRESSDIINNSNTMDNSIPESKPIQEQKLFIADQDTISTIFKNHKNEIIDLGKLNNKIPFNDRNVQLNKMDQNDRERLEKCKVLNRAFEALTLNKKRD